MIAFSNPILITPQLQYISTVCFSITCKYLAICGTGLVRIPEKQTK
jgi:hypothetical protein